MDNAALKDLETECREHFRALWPEEPKPLVFGDGNPAEPVLMLIGEAPGEQEALQGKPFVGKAGKNLTAFLAGVGLRRDELYISNVVKIRPSRISPAGRMVNRPPTGGEIELFTPWLYREIALVRPRALVTLGNVALHAFVSRELTIGDCHGRWREAALPPAGGTALRMPLFALYHPASVIYNRALATVYEQDLQTLRRSLQPSGSETDS